MRDDFTFDDIARYAGRIGCCLVIGGIILLIGAGYALGRWLL